MDVHVLIREDQSDHGYIDTSIVGLFARESDAADAKASQELEARTAGSLVCGDQGDWDESDWEVSWMVEKKELR